MFDSWAKSAGIDMEKLMESNQEASADSWNATISAMVPILEKQGMGAGETYDELKKMHISLADGFATQYDFDVARWRTEKEMLDEANRKKTDKAEGKEVTDKSLDFAGTGVIGILAAVSGFIIGFFEGFFGPIKKMIMKPLTFGWKSFKAIIKDSA